MTQAAPRLLVIGNSHIAGPRLAYVADPGRWPGWDVDFLGMLAGNIGRLELRDGALEPVGAEVAAEMKRYNLVRRLPVSGYDALAIVGGFGWTTLAELCAHHRSLDFPSIRAGETACQLVGRSFLDSALRARCRSAAAFRLMRQLRGLDVPLLMLPEPMPSAECRDDPGRFAAYLDLVDRGDAGFWRDWFQRAAKAEAGGDVRLLFWREDILLGGALTRPELMRGAMRLWPDGSQPQPQTDFAHGNVDYGRLVMDRIVATLSAG